MTEAAVQPPLRSDECAHPDCPLTRMHLRIGHRPDGRHLRLVACSWPMWSQQVADEPSL